MAVIDRVVSTKIQDMTNLSRRNALFCDPNGRICDIATIFRISDSLLLCSSNSEKEITRRKLVDGTSWDEECDILIADSAIFRITIFPSDFREFYEIFGIDMEEKIPDELIEKDDHLFVKYQIPYGIRIDVLVKFENLDNTVMLLREYNLIELDSERWKYLRIILGIREMCDVRGNLPDEMGLGGLVSNEKGCYPGQEVHARMESMGKKTKTFCRLRGHAPVILGRQKTPDFGTISVTSAVFLDGQAIAFALIRLRDKYTDEIKIEGNTYSIEIMGYP